MDMRDKFERAVARLFRENLLSEGMLFVQLKELEQLAKDEGIPEHLAGLILEDLEARGLIFQDRRIFKGGEQLILTYEQEVDRGAFYESNIARRELLEAASDALDNGEEIQFRRDSAENYTDRPWNEARSAAHMLQAVGLGTLRRETMGGNFDFTITADGYQLARDPAELTSTLPTSAEEDTARQEAPVVREEQAGAAEQDGRPRAFISYSHRDQEFVLALVAELQAQDVRVWIDQVELDIGDSLIERISEAIAEEDFVVAVISPHSVESSWCKKELSLAVTEGINNKHVKVLPVRLGEVEMPPMLADLKWGDAEADTSPSDLAAGLARAIKRNIARRGQEVAVTRAPEPDEPGSARPPVSYDSARVETALDAAHEALMQVVEAWDRNRAGAGTTDDIRAQQRRLVYALDRLPGDVRLGLPLVSFLSEAPWNEYLRLHDYREVEPDIREEFRAVTSLVEQGLPIAPRWKIARTDGVVDSRMDATAYLWWIGRGEDVRPITVFITGSAEASTQGLPKDVVAAKETAGRSVVTGLLGLDDPPRRVMVSTAGVRWEADAESA